MRPLKALVKFFELLVDRPLYLWSQDNPSTQSTDQDALRRCLGRDSRGRRLNLSPTSPDGVSAEAGDRFEGLPDLNDLDLVPRTKQSLHGVPRRLPSYRLEDSLNLSCWIEEPPPSGNSVDGPASALDDILPLIVLGP